MSIKTLGLEYGDKESRIKFFEDNCYAVEETSYMKDFTPEEIAQMKERLSEVSIKINDIDEEKKKANELFKLKMKPLSEDKHELLKNIKQKSELVTENCYKFVDEETRTVEIYNADGICISQRPAFANELQKTIFQFKTGTND
jgi:hypothetical protein